MSTTQIPEDIARHMPAKCEPWCESTDRHYQYVTEMEFCHDQDIADCRATVSETQDWRVRIYSTAGSDKAVEIDLQHSSVIDGYSARRLAGAIIRAAALIEGSNR